MDALSQQRDGRDRDPGVPAQAGRLMVERCASALRLQRVCRAAWGCAPCKRCASSGWRRDRKIAPMLQQRTLKSLTRAVGVGLHSGQKVELTLRPGAARHRHRVPPRRPAAAGGHPGRRAEAVSDTRMASTISPGGDPARQGADRRAPDVGLRRPGPRQPASSTSPPTKCRSSTARRRRFVFLLQSAGIELQNAPQRFIRVHQAGRGARRRGRRAEVGAARAVPRLQAQLRDRLRPPGGRRHRPARRVRHGLGPLQARHRARAHLRLHARTSR